MNTLQFGATNLSVTPIGLGMAALGRPGYINLGHGEDLQGEVTVEAMEANAHTVLDAAWAAGIRYFDAARSYGRAEQFLSSWLATRRVDPKTVTVGSKWGYTYTAGWQVEAEKHEVKEHSLAVLNRQIGESNGLLGRYLDLYQIHSATLESGVLTNNEVLARLGELRDSGLVIGLSLSGPAQAETLRRALEVRVGGRPLFGSVQATWNLLAQEAGPALQDAHDAGWGVIIKEALANGRLTDRNEEPAFADTMRRLQQLAATHDSTVDALALKVALDQPFAHCVLSGATTAEQLTSNVAAVNLDGSLLEDSLEAYAEPPEAYWQRRSELAWN